jgi:hypothetical protein
MPVLEIVLSAIAASLVVAGTSAYHRRRFAGWSRGLDALCVGLGKNADDASIAALEGRLERLRRETLGHDHGVVVWGRWTIHAAVHAARAGRGDAALRWLEALPLADLPPSLRAMQAQAMAALAIGEGNRALAREAVARVRRPAPSREIEQGLVAVEGLLEALEGDAAAARQRAEDALATKLHPNVRLTWQATLAHALVALDDTPAARTLLASLRSAERGSSALRRIVRQSGPASTLAASLLSDDGPYR